MKLGLRAKINAGILSLVLIVMGILVGFMAINLRKQAKTANFRLYDNIGREISSKASSAFNLDLGLTRALASSYAGFADMSQEALEDIYQRLLKQEMESHEKYLAFWISLELKELDPSYPHEYGRITWLYDRLGGELKYRKEYKDTNPEALSPQYQEIKGTKKESLIDPYWYVPGYDGAGRDSLLETTVAVPVLRNNQVVGLAGIDFTLDHFSELNHFQIEDEIQDAVLFSNNGTILTHENEKLIGKHLQQTELFGEHAATISEAIANGKEWQIQLEQDNELIYYSFHPIFVGESDSPWSVCVSVPVSQILAAANKVFWRAVLFGLFGLLFLSFMVSLLSSRIIGPVEETTRQLTRLSTGQINDFDIQATSARDEIGAMTRALHSLSNRLKAVIEFSQAIGEGKLDARYPYQSESDVLGQSLTRMQQNLIELQTANANQDWVKTGLNGLNKQIRGDQELDDLVKQMISYVAKYLKASAGALYITDEENRLLRLAAGYAFSKRKELNNRIAFGEGLVGQCLIEKEMIMLSDVPADYFPIKSATGSAKPRQVIVYPCLYNGRVLAVLEFATLSDLDDLKFDFLEAASQSIAIGLNSAFAREEMKKLLSKTLEQKEELQAQEEELREANQELEKQAESLRQSEASLQAQQEELRVTNQELEKNAQMLEEQAENIRQKNHELEVTRQEIEKKAEELALASKYKSEFLANMSHELRTPLNSMLILSQALAENTDGNLNPGEVESAEIIYKSGKDLLNLINEVLDLSKIEAGKMNIHHEAVSIKSMANNLERLFRSVVEEKGLTWVEEINTDTPDEIWTDHQRVEQVLKNLLSNAVKFTQQGAVTLRFKKPGTDQPLRNPKLTKQSCIAIDVQDTGMGISKEKQHLIFEAFQQEDGSTSRRFGGTGLGLSISKELAALLGGEIHLSSEQGKGSVFTLILPVGSPYGTSEQESTPSSDTQTVKETAKQTAAREMSPEPAKPEISPDGYPSYIPDDRNNLTDTDPVMVIIEDDPEFSRILVDQCHNKGFQCLTAGSGEAGLWLTGTFRAAAVILDIKLPGIDGWQVLDALKKDVRTRHIPVHMISGEEESLDAYQKGAMGYLTKPVTREQLQDAFENIGTFLDKNVKHLLIVEDDKRMSQAIRKVIEADDIHIEVVGNGEACLNELNQNHYDCIILDLGLPDMSGFDLMKEIKNRFPDHTPPIIVYTGQDLTREQDQELKKYAKSIIVKGVRSEERLLDETALFMHRVMSDLSEHQQKILQKLYTGDSLFQGKKILLVDDDMRNIFALTKVFQDKGMEVFKAENGKKALDLFRAKQSFDLVLMDIMMPEMDGYEAIKEIRKLEDCKDLPVIALTAKAMKEDKQKCLDAGASDYITKPVDVPKLLSLIRVWLSKD